MAENPKEETFENIANSAGLVDALASGEDPELPESNSENKAEDSKQSKGEEEKPQRSHDPWVSVEDFDFKKDLRSLYKNPFWIIVTILAALILALFIALFLELKKEETYRNMMGYVRIHHRAPPWYKQKLPEEAQESIRNYHIKHEKELEKFQIDKPDPHADEKVIGDKYPNPVSNEDVVKILKKQKIGPVNDFGAENSEKANLSGLNLTKLNYRYMNKFVGANLRYCDLSGIEAIELIFRGASLQYAQFVESKIERANFIRARINNSNFYLAKAPLSLFESAIAIEAHFAEADLTGSNLNEAVFKEADFSNAILEGITAKQAFMEAANFSEASLINANFTNANLRGASFARADLRCVNFRNANLDGANFDGANIEGAIFDNADIAMANFRNVQNISFEQINKSKFLLSAKNIPIEIIPKKYSWRERFKPPKEADEG